MSAASPVVSLCACVMGSSPRNAPGRPSTTRGPASPRLLRAAVAAAPLVVDPLLRVARRVGPPAVRLLRDGGEGLLLGLVLPETLVLQPVLDVLGLPLLGVADLVLVDVLVGHRSPPS